MKDYPIIKYVILFIIGIVLTKLILFPIEYLFGIIILFILIVAVLSFFNQKKLITVPLLLIAMIVGFLYASFWQLESVQYPFIKSKIPNSTIYGSVEEISLLHDNKFTIVLLSDSVHIADSIKTIRNKFQCNISFKMKKRTVQLYQQLQIGNKIKISGTLRKGRIDRNPGEFNYYKYLQTKSIVGLLYLKNSKNLKILDRQIKFFKNTILKSRKWIASKIDALYNKQTAALLKGLLLADRNEIDYETKNKFVNSGVIHVLAVSGLHVGFVVLIFLFLFSRIPIYPRTILTIVGLVLFLLLANTPASVFRATIMVVVMLLIYLSNRTYNAINGLAIAALVLLLINPLEIFNPGFQLSFSAVLSILVLYPILSKRITTKNKLLRSLLLFSAVSFSAQIGTLPFTLMYFHKLSLISLFANLFVIPIIGIIVGLGVLSILFSAFSKILALYFASSNMLSTDLLMKIVDITGTQHFLYLFIPNFSLIDGIVFYLFLIIAIYSFLKFSNYYSTSILFVLIGFNLFLYLQLDNKELLPSGKLSVMVIDIGQGDSIFLKFPNGKTALIDAGNASQSFDNGERVIAPLLQRLSIDKIDFGFITHVDSDHYKGFLSLIKNGWIKEIYKPRLDTTLQKDIRLENIIINSKTPYHYYSKSELNFGNIKFYILNDTTNLGYNNLDMNNRSGVFKIVYGNNSFLFTGDAERQAEKLLINLYGDFLNSDILKIGHHGSKSSSSQKFIESVSPSIGLISAGLNNKFGHPMKIILDRYFKNNVTLYRTDIEGSIILQSDGDKIKKINWREF